MRVAFYGNTCNNLYQLARACRESAGVDAHLFVERRSDPQQRPESDDPHLRAAYPDWIHEGHWLHPVVSALAPRLSPLLPRLRSFDAFVTSGYGPMLAAYTPVPTFFLTSGGDLTMYPFRRGYVGDSRLRSWLHFLRAPAQALGIHRCAEIWTQPFRPFQEPLDRLRIAGRRQGPFYLLLDTDRFRPVAPDPGLRARGDFILFHPARLMMSADLLSRRTGDYKGNERLLEGFARFVRSVPSVRSVLALIDRPASRDRDEARRLCERLGLGDRVVWLRPPREFGFSRDELLALYSASDVVADDFGMGWFGSVTLEGLAAGKPVVNFVDEAAMGQLYPWHPLVSARRPEEIAAALETLWADPHARRERGAQGRRWVEEFHAYHQVGPRYVDRIRRRLSA